MSQTINLISIADNPIDQEHGLKYVRHLPELAGMLFKFQSPRVLSFWMQDTYVPIEIAFVDREGIIVKTERMIPLSLRSVTSGRPCVMALEVPAGTFEKMGCVIGKKMSVDFDKKQATIHD